MSIRQGMVHQWIPPTGKYDNDRKAKPEPDPEPGRGRKFIRYLGIFLWVFFCYWLGYYISYKYLGCCSQGLNDVYRCQSCL